MQLEDWIKKDMTRFIKEHEPEIAKALPVRHEDFGIIGQIDYERHVKRALDQNRFGEASKYFNELKDKFLHLPKEHSQERKRYYRILQKCYKLIYDYVEDRHKTSRLLGRLDDNADVFDDNVQPVDLKQQDDDRLVMPSIEEMMFRKKTQLPKPDDTAEISMPSQESVSQPMASPVTDEQRPSQEPPGITTDTIPDRLRHAPSKFAPKFTPPNLSFGPTHHESAHEEPPEKRTLDVQALAADRLIQDAREALGNGDIQRAREKLIEARFEHFRSAADEKQLQRIQSVEQEISSRSTRSYAPPMDAEMFSSLYIKGVHAMQAGDYKAAAHLFAKRMHQAPNDVAARIRYQECAEVLHGKAA